MAGGALGVHVPCLVCLTTTGAMVKATRIREGRESDQYRCGDGHEFGMDWPKGPATESLWPTPSQVDPAKKPR